MAGANVNGAPLQVAREIPGDILVPILSTKSGMPNYESSLTAAEWRQIVNSAVETAVISLDPEGRVTTWSRGAQSMLGWSEAEMLGRTIECLFTEEDRRRNVFAQELEDARNHGRGLGAEGWRLRKDGSRVWGAGEVAPIMGPDGTIIGFVKILRDRTEQRANEMVVREERRALQILNRVGSQLAMGQDLHQLVQLATDAGVELTGAEFGAFFYNVVDDAGKTYMLYTLSGAPVEAFSKFPMPRNTAVFAPTFRGEGIIRSRDITKDPRYGRNAPYAGMPEGHLPVRSYLAVPVVSRAGEVLGGLFFGHAREGVFSERSERGLEGLAAQAAIAIDNARLYAAAQREIAERQRTEASLQELNATLEHKVSERTEQLKRSEEALRQAQKMEAIGQLTGGVAHDFNNLLQAITGNLEILQRHLPEESGRAQRAAAQAIAGAERAAALTQRLLAFARRQPLDPKPTHINALVTGMSDLLHRSLGELVAVEIVLGVGLWQAEIDPNGLESAILNLVLNARDAMPGGGRLTIETSNAYIDEHYAAKAVEVRPGQYVLISVSDSGTGMDEATIARAVEPFFTTKPVGLGTGLGLSQVYGFVKQSGGHLKIYSEPGQGTTVKIYLPRLVGAVDVIEETEALLPPEGEQESILVVEDDDGVRSVSVETLMDLGYRVLEAADGAMALRVLEHAGHIDLLFTDVVLPGGMTGADVAAKARELRPDIKVLFTTGYARNAIFHHGRIDKGVQLITKPFTLKQLAEKVRAVLDGMD
ncbi:PAS domain S-box-containing protein [Dokdonella fugitiva]|uniref:histidine kinase n=1 Tax=Dokdonella fugitiva TaxID=328517 RepID=A0A4R2I8C6_9GAMM|nr:PAS domain S-box-containing protein [Dokdonella fugitiva]